MAGGARPGAGRKKGVPNKATAEIRAKAACSGLLPHEFLLAVCRGEKFDGYTPTFDQRMDAAGKAAPYYAPRLSSVEMNATVKRTLADFSEAELLAIATGSGGRDLETAGGAESAVGLSAVH